jgi:GNAT superfamily N-acetyltransferase
MSEPALQIRLLQVGDRGAVQAFRHRIPSGELAFLDRFLLSDVAVAGWTQRSPARRFGAFDGEQMVGVMSVTPGAGWMSRVGELRVLIEPEARGRGLLSHLVERGVIEAEDMALAKLTIEVSAELRPVADMFVERFGFVQEGLLRDHVDDAAGNRHDLLILSRFLPAS